MMSTREISRRTLVRAPRGRGVLWLELVVAAVLLGGFRTGTTSAQTHVEQPVSTSPEKGWRAAFRAATDNKAQEAFLAFMVSETDTAAVNGTATVRANAYLAVGQLLVGAQRRNVFSKWRSFRIWTSALDQLVQKAPDDPELRFLRVTVQSSAPGFLGYSGDLETDCHRVRAALESGYWETDPGHKEFVQTTTSSVRQCQIDQ